MNKSEAEQGPGGAEHPFEGMYSHPRDHLRDELERLALRLESRLGREERGGSEGALADREAEIDARMAAFRAQGGELPLERLVSAFELDDFEVDVLLAALAPAVDPRFGELYARAQGSGERRFPTVGLLLDLLAAPEERAERMVQLSPRGRLFGWRLLELEGGSEPRSTSWFLRPVFADLHILGVLLGSYALDPQLDGVLRPVELGDAREASLTPELEHRLDVLAQHIAKRPAAPTVVHLRTFDLVDASDLAASLARRLGLRVLQLDASRLLASASREGLVSFLRTVMRDVILFRGCLMLGRAELLGERGSDADVLRREGLAALVGAASLCILQSDDDALGIFARRALAPGSVRWLELDLSAPSFARRRAAWEDALGAAAVPVELGALGSAELASRHPLTPGQIRTAVETARDLALMQPHERVELGLPELRSGIRSQGQRLLTGLATRVDVGYRWEDLVLPPTSLAQLREICAHHSQRETVLEDWGFGERLRSGLGIHAVFSGPPGTGKTMGAAIIARELGLELFKIDLSAVVSKYVGETEKNLGRIFREAVAAQLVLFFDEADALFAKRTKVEDSHDRYANLETGYLLQQIEAYPGITILATNLSENIDTAFLRRMSFVIDFPFPAPPERKKILESLFPRAAPRASDLDLDYLSERFLLSGGNLRNVALRAAFGAAHEGVAIGMKHVLRAAKHEYGKMGKPFVTSDFPEYRALLDDELRP